MNRRTFLRKSAGFAGMALGGLAIHPPETFPRPSNLTITGIRGCTVDMALFDITGEVLGVPAHKILGTKLLRDKIDVYAELGIGYNRFGR